MDRHRAGPRLRGKIMTTLATYKTASGNHIALVKGGGAIEVTANGKFSGMYSGLQAQAGHGTVITLVGVSCVVQVTLPSQFLTHRVVV